MHNCVRNIAIVLVSVILTAHVSRAIQYADPDSYGYRYCANWKLADGTPLYTDCDPYDIQRCGQTLKFEYKCCPGFKEIRGSLGGKSSPCGEVIPPFQSCLETLSNLGHSTFATSIDGRGELREGNTPLTLFAVNGGSPSSSEEAAAHMVNGRFYAKDLQNGMELETVSGEKLQIVRYSSGVVTVNCQELVSANVECASGVIHTLRNSVLGSSRQSGQDRSSVYAHLRSNEKTRAFAEDLPDNLRDSLSKVESNVFYTVMAPDSSQWRKLSSKYSKQQRQKIAASHVKHGLTCSAGITKTNQQMKTVGKTKLDVDCKVSGRNEKRTIKSPCSAPVNFEATDLMAANGVIHILNKPVIPTSAMKLQDLYNNPDCAKELHIDAFVNVLKECDIYIEEGLDYAIVVPDNSAFDWWRDYPQFRDEYARFQNDKDYRCRVARYHVVRDTGRLKSVADFAGHTQGHRTNNKNDYLYETTYVTKDKYGSKLNFHYSTISNLDTTDLDGITLYRTSTINAIPEKNITDILQEPEYKIAALFTKQAEMEEKVFQKNAPNNLYLVTSDDGWRDPRARPDSKNPNLPELKVYESSPDHVKYYSLLNHVPLYLWGGDIGYFKPNSVHQFMSSANVELTFWKDAHDVMRIGYPELPKSDWPKVVKSNLHARDGMVWVLDGVLKCPESLCPYVVQDRDVFTFSVAACRIAELYNEGKLETDFQSHPIEIAERHLDECVLFETGKFETIKPVSDTGDDEHDH